MNLDLHLNIVVLEMIFDFCGYFLTLEHLYELYIFVKNLCLSLSHSCYMYIYIISHRVYLTHLVTLHVLDSLLI